MTNEINLLATWWAVFLALGIIGFPTAYLFFKKFVDLGYGFAKTISLLTVSYLTFVLSIFRIFSFGKQLVFFSLGLFLVTNFLIFIKNKKEILKSIEKSLSSIFLQEALFSAGFFAWAKIRGFHPDINGLEKFMDYGFINSILNSQFLPPADMWYAGEPINYYWFGHLTTAVTTLLSNIPAAFSYNLMIATILGLSLTASFSIAASLAQKITNKKRAIITAGLISAVLLNFAGNFHTPIYAIKEGRDKYWYPDATRFIGYNPETNDKTIHEFPIYSYVVSDLHAHLLNLPFVLLYIALLLNYTLRWEVRSGKLEKEMGSEKTRTSYFKNLASHLSLLTSKKNLVFGILPLGLVLGVMFMTNTWDFGNYLLLTGVLLFVFKFFQKGFWEAVYRTALTSVAILVISLVFTTPFLLNFESIAKGIDFVNARTPLWQLGVLWGFPALLTICFVLTLAKLKFKFKRSDLFVASLLMTTWVLIILPEAIYVKDIYIASHHRANTMFKLTYQAFVMSYLASGYITVRVLSLFKNYLSKFLVSLVFVSVFASILWYPSFAIKAFYQELKTYKGLNGESWLSEQHPDTYQVINWLRENVEGQPTILEAPGDSYTEFNVISAYTGLPTVSGWFVHEWLWRGSAEIPQARVTDIQQVYTSEDIALTQKLLSKYNVEYVIIGSFERQKYPSLNEEKFPQLGTEVFSSGNTKIYKVN